MNAEVTCPLPEMALTREKSKPAFLIFSSRTSSACGAHVINPATALIRISHTSTYTEHVFMVNYENGLELYLHKHERRRRDRQLVIMDMNSSTSPAQEHKQTKRFHCCVKQTQTIFIKSVTQYTFVFLCSALKCFIG